ncbi:MAG: hypothetical protein SPG61_03755, partial [Arcanobacterium sp.]|nr:hypothetical protein [Arcanobacterium sp.]
MSSRSIERLSWPTIIGMILLPVLVFGSFLGLATTQAAPLGAIINNDQPTDVAGEVMTLGDEVAQGMIEDKNISWEITDAKTAEQGLKDGKYAAAVTIASDFTKKAASFTNNNAAETSTALLEIKVSDNTTLVDGLVAQIVNSVATDSVNAALSEAYLDGLMLGFNEVHGALELIADGTKQIQDGSKELADGAGEAKDGSLELNDGLRQLRDGSNELFAGTMELRQGTQELRAGAGQLDAGAAELKAGTAELADGA